MVLAMESPDVLDLGDDPAGDHRPDTVEVGQVGAGGLNERHDLPADVLQLRVQCANVFQMPHRVTARWLTSLLSLPLAVSIRIADDGLPDAPKGQDSFEISLSRLRRSGPAAQIGPACPRRSSGSLFPQSSTSASSYTSARTTRSYGDTSRSVRSLIPAENSCG